MIIPVPSIQVVLESYKNLLSLFIHFCGFLNVDQLYERHFPEAKSPLVSRIIESTSHGVVNTSINPSSHHFTQGSVANFYSSAFKIRLPRA